MRMATANPLAELDSQLVQIVDSAVAESIRRSGSWVQCRAGCGHCCHGPFAVTTLDLARLRRGFAELPKEQATRIASRAAEVRDAMRAGFPGDWLTGRVDSIEHADAFDERHPWLPCPVLDVETGACSMHESRPLACRLHGSAMRVDGLDLKHCRLNYQGALPEQVEACRVNVATNGVESAVIEAFEEQGNRSHLTYIAWAFPEPVSIPAADLGLRL